MPTLAANVTMLPPIEKGAAAVSQMRSRRRRLAGVREIVEDDDELVAAEAGEQVVAAHLVAESLGDPWRTASPVVAGARRSL
jgi:hypothetical protein